MKPESQCLEIQRYSGGTFCPFEVLGCDETYDFMDVPPFLRPAVPPDAFILIAIF
jgi:hypothetical protein